MSSGVILSKVGYGSIAELAWGSNVIVEGTVTEIRNAHFAPARPANSPASIPAVDRNLVYTDYVVTVNAAYRGDVGETVIVRQQGGSVDNVHVYNWSEPFMQVGDRGLFFLNPYPKEDGLTANGEIPYSEWRTWWVTEAGLEPAMAKGPDGTIAQFPPEAIQSYDLILQQVTEALRSEPVGHMAVPLDESPRGRDLP